MGIWNRLGNVIKSYINDGIENIGEKSFREKYNLDKEDEDYRTAFEELDDYLKGENPDYKIKYSRKPGSSGTVPDELRADFTELGLTINATEAECREAYKKLIRTHHPDHHGGDTVKMKQATEKTAKINAAYDRLINWFKTYK